MHSLQRNSLNRNTDRLEKKSYTMHANTEHKTAEPAILI